MDYYKKDIKESPRVIIKPTQIPFKCPVCNGFGTLQNGSKECHGCQRKGYVVIAQEYGQKDRL